MLSGLFLVLGIISLIYFVALVMYAGIQLSFVGIWVLLGMAGIMAAGVLKSPRLFSVVLQIPRGLRMGAGFLMGAGLLVFLGAQICIVSGMIGKSPGKLDGIIVLGAQVRGTRVSRALAQRLDRAADYLQEYPNAYVIVSGGQGTGEDISEAKAMSLYLLDRGVEADRIILEDRSVNTVQNLKYSFALLRNSEDHVGLVSNSFHVFRAVHIANAQGRNVTGIPAKTDWWMLPHYMMREGFALVKDFLLGNAVW